MLRTCDMCARFLLAKRKVALCPVGLSYTFEKVALDTGNITLNLGRKEYFLVAVDYFTKWVKIKAVSARLA